MTTATYNVFPNGSNLNAEANEFKPFENKEDDDQSSGTETEQPDSPLSVESLGSNYDRPSPPQAWLQPPPVSFLKPLTPSSCSTTEALRLENPYKFTTEISSEQDLSQTAYHKSEKSLKEFVILRGLPGSGKTTVAKKLGFEVEGRRISPVICSADNYLPGERDQHEPAFVRDAHAQCRADFVGALKVRAPLVVLDDVHERRWHYQMYLDFARSEGYSVRVVELRPYSSDDLWKCWRRNVHGYDKQAFLTLCRDWEEDRSAEVLLVKFR